jgi:hypothetical protein
MDFKDWYRLKSTNAIAEDNFNLRTGYSALGFTKQGIPSNPLTQFNYSSLQLKDTAQ